MRNVKDLDDDIFDTKPTRRRIWVYVVLGIFLLALLFGSQLLGIYIDSLWFRSLGYSQVYWYKFRIGGVLFGVSLVVTFLALRLPLLLLNRALPQLTERPRVRVKSLEDMRDINVLPYIYRPGVWLISAVVSLITAVNFSQSWSDFALYLNASPDGNTDPLFGKDISFYLFTLPVWEMISGWLTSVSVILFLVAFGSAGYVWYLERARGFLSEDVRKRAVGAISGAAALLAFTLAVRTYLSRYDLLNGRQALFTGADFTDVHVRLPALYVLAAVLIFVTVLLTANALFLSRTRVLVWAVVIVVGTWALGLLIIPQAVYSFSVKPNELAKESPYIQHNIVMTRRALGIDRFEERPFQPATTLTAQQLNQSQPMLDNVRLWDRQILQLALSQIQEIRNYYDFQLPDVDRYVINGRLRQVMLAGRELNIQQLPEQSRNWINQHIVYTHGFGVTMNTVNEFTAEGLPHLVLRDMPVHSEAPEIKVTRPEIYFGEKTNYHVYVRTKPQAGTEPEFNYPAAGNTDSYTEYGGSAGIEVGGALRQMALSLYLGDGTNLLFSDYITSESRVLIRRNVSERVQQLAPFLIFDNDPYVVINREGRLFWIIDGFTFSDRYPYASSYRVGDRSLNYLRNSVKAVVDAYEGSVTFYVFEPDDPIIRAHRNVFPSLFRSAAELPADLMEHVRYPSLMLDVQARAYTLYHMQNSQTFYNHEDVWAIALADVSADQQGREAEEMQPYHVMLQLPGEQNAPLEFVNILPFTPSGGRNNMIGWMGARSDGANYGHTLVFSFPKNLTVSGPAQVRARVSQDPQISSQITLWDQKGSKVIRGSLLVIPIADSLLYVEPFFLQAQNSPLPELRLVAVATQQDLGYGKTFDEALKALVTQLQSRGGEAPLASAQPEGAKEKPAAGKPPPMRPATAEDAQMLRQAQQLLADYERLTAEGKHREAGEKLDQLKQLLNRNSGG